MNKLLLTSLSVAILSLATLTQANTKLCKEVTSQISKLDKHADDFYSLANYQFDDYKLLKKLKRNARYFNDESFEQVLEQAETAIKHEDKDLMIKMAPVSRYLNDWNLENCS